MQAHSKVVEDFRPLPFWSELDGLNSTWACPQSRNVTGCPNFAACCGKPLDDDELAHAQIQDVSCVNLDPTLTACLLDGAGRRRRRSSMWPAGLGSRVCRQVLGTTIAL
jgi:hypothetical protein